ncbi:MAG: cadherin-like domain-containing protein [Psychrobium sp.]|nr:cadherin-like domain-containing protein [Psychrobium sp.]
MKRLLSFVTASLCCVISWQAIAEQQSRFNEWQQVLAPIDNNKAVFLRANAGFKIRANIASLNETLVNTDQSVVISLPLPNGSYADFRLVPSLIMADELAQRYPMIKTFTGYQIDKESNRGRFDITPQGFHGVFNLAGDTVFIDPIYREKTDYYISYYKRDAVALAGSKGSLRLAPKLRLQQPLLKKYARGATKQLSAQRITYRIAIAANAEFTQYHGGSKENGLAAITSMLNRINDVYERDLNISLQLVANNDAIIYTNIVSDPYDNSDNDGEINTGIIDGVIGSQNYDIGHIVGTGGGGLASLGVVCDAQLKGDGVTGDPNPSNDSFYIDYVAHEIGHQFGAEHTFNGTEGACSGNREAPSSFEPGSASTIMGYAGICGQQNLQMNSQPFFHSHSMDQISAFVSSELGSSCGVVSASDNAIPTVNAGADYIIPANTPFILTGSATDANGDELSYDWQQMDLGPSSSASTMVDDGKRPLFRAWQPTKTPTRILPKLQDVLAAKISIGEVYANTTRELNFRLIARDNKGGVSYDAMKVNVVKTELAFSVLEPTNQNDWGDKTAIIRWQVAGTDQAPISCQSVDITLSTDSGNSFPVTLASQVANTGSFTVTVPSSITATARVKVSCFGNIFFAINNGDFSIAQGGKPVITSLVNNLLMDEDISLKITPEMFTYLDVAAKSMKVLEGANYQIQGDSTIVPDANFHGLIRARVIGVNNGIESDVFTVKITVLSVNDLPLAAPDSISINQGSAAVTIDVLSNDSDVDEAGSLTLQAFNYLGAGSVKIANNQLVYQAHADFSGVETIEYTVSDSLDGQSKGIVSITVIAKKQTKKSSSAGASLWLLLLGSIYTQATWKCRIQQVEKRAKYKA